MMRDYTQHTPLIVAGRSPSFAERQYWQRLHDGLSRVAVWLAIILTLFFGYSATWSVWRQRSAWEIVLSGVVLVPGMALVAFYPRYGKHTVQNALKTAWYNEQADKARLFAGNTVTLWDDRAVWTDLRGETTLFFRDVTLCTESVHGFFLQAGTATLLLRAADLTTEQVAAVRERLRTALPQERYRTKSTAIGCLHEALPLPAFENDDTVTFRTAVEVALPRVGALHKKRRQLGRMFLTPAGLIYGCLLANTVSVTGQYALDLVLFCVATVAGMYALSTLLTWQKKTRKTTVYVAFTRDGVALFAGGQHFFYVWERVKLRENAHYIWITFPEGESLKLNKGDSYHG